MRTLEILQKFGAAFLILFFAWAFIVMCSGCAGHNYAKISAGVLSAYALHESGHELASKLTGADIKWSWGKEQIATWDAERKGSSILSASGLIAQSISSEVILRNSWHNDYTNGIMAWNVINPILYAADYWLGLGRTNISGGGKYQGDLAGIEYYSGKQAADLFAFASVAVALWQGYRYVKSDQRLNYGVTVSGDGSIRFAGLF